MAAHEQLNIFQSAMYEVPDFAKPMNPITRTRPSVRLLKFLLAWI